MLLGFAGEDVYDQVDGCGDTGGGTVRGFSDTLSREGLHIPKSRKGSQHEENNLVVCYCDSDRECADPEDTKHQHPLCTPDIRDFSKLDRR